MAIARKAIDGAKVALFFDEDYVDTDDNGSSPGGAIRKSLGHLGYDVSLINDPEPASFIAALRDADILHIPSLDFGNFRPSDTIIHLVREFVRDGGTLVLNNSHGDYTTDFVNAVFDTSIVRLRNADTTDSGKTAKAAGTTFGDDPGTIPGDSEGDGPSNFETDAWQTSTLPTGSVTFYSASKGASTVWGFQHGKGQVIMLGWNWYDARPNGSDDNGWLEVLDSALSRTDGVPTGKTIKGRAGDDTISSTQSPHGEPKVTKFDDFITAGKGDDKVRAGGGSDWVSGGDGKDQINGDSGGDYILGGANDDVLRGGPGEDVFVFKTALANAGRDTLADFEKHDDHIVLSRKIFTRFDLGEIPRADYIKHIDVTSDGVISYEVGNKSYAFAKVDESRDVGIENFIVVA